MIDYMVMEAVYLKAQDEEAKAAKQQKIKDWKKDRKKLNELG